MEAWQRRCLVALCAVPVGRLATRCSILQEVLLPPQTRSPTTRTLTNPLPYAGSISTLNALAAEHNAIAIIHSGDFGFYGSSSLLWTHRPPQSLTWSAEQSSLTTISERTLRHLVQYSSLIPPSFRSLLLSPSTSFAQMKVLLASPPSGTFPSSTHFGLSEFPRFLSGELSLDVPVYTVWGACEDVAILEKIRVAGPSALRVPVEGKARVPSPATTSGYAIPNLTVLDEATTRVLLIGGVRLRLFGLGGAVVGHKLFDNGLGTATIAGGGGTMWTTMLQVGEMVDTAQKVLTNALLVDY